MTKREQLVEILDNLKAGRYSDKQLKALTVDDVNGKPVRLSAPEAVAVLEARIAQATEPA